MKIYQQLAVGSAEQRSSIAILGQISAHLLRLANQIVLL